VFSLRVILVKLCRIQTNAKKKIEKHMLEYGHWLSSLHCIALLLKRGQTCNKKRQNETRGCLQEHRTVDNAEVVRGRNIDEVFSGLCHSARRDEAGNEVKGSERGLFLYSISLRSQRKKENS
jgi:hypothetical protein